jgi:hypothetical protein
MFINKICLEALSGNLHGIRSQPKIITVLFLAPQIHRQNGTCLSHHSLSCWWHSHLPGRLFSIAFEDILPCFYQFFSQHFYVDAHVIELSGVSSRNGNL